MPKQSYRRAVVVGDLLRDHHIVRWPDPVSTYSAAGSKVFMSRSWGGAFYLADVLYKIAETSALDVVGPEKLGKGKLNEAYQTWGPCPRDPDGESKEQVWRTTEFQGCRRRKTLVSRQPSSRSVTKNSILVIENLGLDFTEDDGPWQRFEKAAQRCGHLVVKTSTLNIVSNFFTFLREKLTKKVTLVVTADTLRERGAVISRGLSWDKTIEDLIEAFAPQGPLHDIASFARVVVRFGLSGVAVLSRSPGDLQMRQNSNKLWNSVRLVRFIYDPKQHEGLFTEPYDSKGGVSGASTVLAAALVRHIADPAVFPLHAACTRALATARRQLETGAGDIEHGLDLDTFNDVVEPDLAEDGKNEKAEAFRCAFPLLNEEGTGETYGYNAPRVSKDGDRSRILRDVAGAQAEAVAALATEVVLWGAAKALADIPKVKYGHYLSVDRDEIERINAFRRVVLAYHDNPEDKNPLSIAVFGPPGSGKSFAIKQVMGDIFGKDHEATTFNMSQLRDMDELNAALHQVHDETVRGGIPLIFFDEFDANAGDKELGWLKHFLAPMQDAEFWDGQALHPLGKAIFVFAGGTSRNFGEFSQKKGKKSRNKKVDYSEAQKKAKVPDFISRLRGYIDVKGPNVVPGRDKDIGTHYIRRAIMLRFQLEQFCPRIIDRRTDYASVGLDVIRAFLFADEYKHGARSISALISTSRLGRQNRFTLSCLPSRDVMNLHVSEDFLPPPRPELYDADLVEDLSRACHEAWAAAKRRKNYVYGEERNDDPNQGDLTHPRLLPYEELSEAWKEDNRKPSRLFLVKAEIAGYHLKHAGKQAKLFRPGRKMHMAEHDFWVRSHLIKGIEYATKTNDDLFMHRSMQPFNSLSKDDSELDQAIVDSWPEVLKARGYRLVKKPARRRPTKRRAR